MLLSWIDDSSSVKKSLVVVGTGRARTRNEAIWAWVTRSFGQNFVAVQPPVMPSLRSHTMSFLNGLEPMSVNGGDRPGSAGGEFRPGCVHALDLERVRPEPQAAVRLRRAAGGE